MSELGERVVQFAKDYTDTVLDYEKVERRLTQLVRPKQMIDLPNITAVNKRYTDLMRYISEYDTTEESLKKIDELEQQGYNDERFKVTLGQASKDLVRFVYDWYAHILALPANLMLKSPVSPYLLQWTVNSGIFIGIAGFSATCGDNLFEQAAPIIAFIPSFSSITRSGRRPQTTEAMDSVNKCIQVGSREHYEKERAESLDKILKIINEEFLQYC